MGNTESNVTSGVKKQTDTSSIQMYKLIDLKGINTFSLFVQLINMTYFLIFIYNKKSVLLILM